ncbi:MAG: D-glycero-beta-D-manno-heptose 1,7-bisphosphate 7-phosphatase [Campylobacterota bacterium]|nr:D-glycero-beta-D-manno-heptose 1,7-bisphosphate 7-phosphatase [Campylobacterota bacterium]
MLHKALFLDRDGIINVDHGYVSKIEDFEFSEGIIAILRQFRDAGYRLFVVTNQSGIGRGYYSQIDFEILTKWMVSELKKQAITIEEVFYCPHTPKTGCHCRKPEIGMIEQATESYPIDLHHSWMIGDKVSDIELADNAGIANSIYIGRDIAEATLSFASLGECKSYFQDNQGKI